MTTTDLNPPTTAYRNRLAAMAAALITAFVVLLAPAAAAQASGPVTQASGPVLITDADCDTGDSRFFCFVNWSGGTGPYAIRWFTNGTARPEYNDQRHVLIGCQPGQLWFITVTITDAAGQQGWVQFACTCSRNQQ